MLLNIKASRSVPGAKAEMASFLRSSAEQTQTYRPDIDGLRALAVLAVLVFHLDSAWLPGGFAGVDAFFVISGYVVTRGLAAQNAGGLATQLAHFYTRRARRLLPALLVCVLAGSLLHALFVVPFPEENAVSTYRTALTALIGLSNFYLVRTNTSYFDGNSIVNPFSHTWSLGVEEQFYLFFPAFLLLARRGHPTSHYRRSLLTLLPLIAGSLWLSARWSLEQPIQAYYLMPSRFWELGMGATLALWEGSGHFFRYTPRFRLFGYVAGLVLLVTAFALTPQNGFPFPWALPSVLATGFLIAWGSVSGANIGLLNSRPLNYIGKLSYSLYLWHWPIICIVERARGLDGAASKILALALTNVFAVASYHLVELPVRFGRALRPAFVMVLALASVLVAGASVEGVQRMRYALYLGPEQDWARDWNAPVDVLMFEGRLDRRTCHYGGGIHAPGLSEACWVRATPSPGKTLFAIGDSHAYSNWPMVLRGVDVGLYDLYAFSLGGCSIRALRPQSQDLCDQYWVRVRDLLASAARPGDVVFLSSFLRNFTLTSQVQATIRNLARVAAERGATVILQAPLPVLDEHPFDCLVTWYGRVREKCRKSKSKDRQEREPSLRFVHELVRSEPNVIVWDPYDLLCPGDYCYPFKNARPLFRDDDHLSLYGSAYLAPDFIAFVRRLGVALVGTQP
jgi:peptidoglycan/LPS O-acetylase OafA/YrhL